MLASMSVEHAVVEERRGSRNRISSLRFTRSLRGEGGGMFKRLLCAFGITALLAFVPATASSAASSSRQVNMRDDCDPATFNAVVGPGTCVKDGGTTFSQFVDQLSTQGRAPAWRFAPDHLSLASGGTVEARNIGGET